VDFSATEVLGDLAFGDVGDEAEVGSGSVDETVSVLHGKAAAIPGAAHSLELPERNHYWAGAEVCDTCAPPPLL
jgi:hypothetical protein